MSNGRGVAATVVIVAAALVIWQLFAVRQHNLLLFPTIGSIFTVSLPSLASFSGAGNPSYMLALATLGKNVFVTIQRVAMGLLLGLPAGAACGLLLFWLRGSKGTSTFVLIVIRSVPMLALVPLFAFWFGSSAVGIVSYIAFGIFLIVASDAFEAAANLSPTTVQLAELLGARGFFLVRTIYVPGIAGPMFSSIRNAVGLSWAFSLGAEYVSAQSGIGYLAFQSYLYADMGKLTIIAAVYIVLGYASNALLNFGLRLVATSHSKI